jgi:hypothetical protein
MSHKAVLSLGHRTKIENKYEAMKISKYHKDGKQCLWLGYKYRSSPVSQNIHSPVWLFVQSIKRSHMSIKILQERLHDISVYID